MQKAISVMFFLEFNSLLDFSIKSTVVNLVKN